MFPWIFKTRHHKAVQKETNWPLRAWAGCRWMKVAVLVELSQAGPDIELRDKAEQRPLCLLLSGPVYPITHQYNRCLFFLSPHLHLIWSENLLMPCAPGSCETNLKLHIKIWRLFYSRPRTQTGTSTVCVHVCVVKWCMFLNCKDPLLCISKKAKTIVRHIHDTSVFLSRASKHFFFFSAG